MVREFHKKGSKFCPLIEDVEFWQKIFNNSIARRLLFTFQLSTLIACCIVRVMTYRARRVAIFHRNLRRPIAISCVIWVWGVESIEALGHPENIHICCTVLFVLIIQINFSTRRYRHRLIRDGHIMFINVFGNARHWVEVNIKVWNGKSFNSSSMLSKQIHYILCIITI